MDEDQACREVDGSGPVGDRVTVDQGKARGTREMMDPRWIKMDQDGPRWIKKTMRWRRSECWHCWHY